MKVLMIHSFHQRRGGDSTYALELAALLRQAGHTVAPFATRHPDDEPSAWAGRFLPPLDLHHRPTALTRGLGRMFWSPRAARAVRDLVRDFQPDVAHLHHVHRHLSPSVLTPLRRAGVPVVWTAHDYELICPEGHLFSQGHPCEACLGHHYGPAIRQRCKWGQLGPSVAVAMEKTLHRWLGVWDHVDRFLCPSRFLADTLVRAGLPAQRVFHQPNFIAPTGPAPTHPGEGWLYAGRLDAHKGIDTIIALARRHPELTVCGTGPMATPIPGADMRGHLDPATLRAALGATRVVVVPSRWYENFPYAVLEAQALGRAVVASRIGGIPEQITDGIDGLLVPPRDLEAWSEALGGLLKDPARARELGAAAAARVRARLGPAAHLRAILAHYRAVTRA